MPALFERFRPRNWSEVVGQDKVINRLTGIRERSGLADESGIIRDGATCECGGQHYRAVAQ